jgi:photosystem II stability/assembly factor-like uncharacterized protein
METRGAVRAPEPAALARRRADVGRVQAPPVADTAVEVVSRSEPTVLWRFGVRGTIGQSRDGGESWSSQEGGVSVDLLAGSAPSPTICWAVGRDGVVILTTDGSTWRRVAFPSGDDLVGIEATDDRTAVVTTRGGDRMRTEDAGGSWTSVRR